MQAANGWEAERTYKLASGIAALVLFLIVLAYVLRKNVHKLGISPEFKMRVPIERLERAETRLNELRVLMASGKLNDSREALQRGKSILKEEGVQRVMRLRLEENNSGVVHLRAMPTDPLGRMARWMQAHLYYGLAAGIMVWFHGGSGPSSGLGATMNGLTLIVVLSGIGGIFLWATMPRLLTKAERDLSIEKAHALLDSLNLKIAGAYETVDASTRALFEDADRSSANFTQRLEAADRALSTTPEGKRQAEDLMALLGQRQQVRQEYDALMRIKNRMHIWRVVHLPGAVLLMVLIAVHVLSIVWY